PVLDGDDATRRERAAVTDPVDLVHDGDVGVARPEEVRVQRVHRPRRVGRAARRHQRLRRDLPSEDPLLRLGRAEPAEEVDLERLELEELQEFVERRPAHGAASYPKKTLADSSSSGGTVLSSRTASSIGTRTMSRPWSATIFAKSFSWTASMASSPNLVARIRSKAVGVPPRRM